ncbi:unnamed protein product [Soboliphyme baturini]|uniref:Helicase n=1 Tax=Soboliphyme baturini TaxID=241478 RepID=A0A183JAG7_9BILA|nr:unnamed protein product [Soboliphyme baturini]
MNTDGHPVEARKELRLNLAPQIIGSRNIPDIVVIDRVGRTVIIVDVAIWFENGREAFDAARLQKIDHYGRKAVILPQ